MELINVIIIAVLYVEIFHCVQAQLTFNPDPQDDIQLQATVLTPAVNVTTDQCYSSTPTFRVQYVTQVDYEVVYDIKRDSRYEFQGQPVEGSSCGNSQWLYRIKLYDLQFIADPVLVGGTFNLKATVNDTSQSSAISRRTYSFPAPYNLTGSSANAVLNNSFTWTCHVTSDYHVIEWYRGNINLGQVGFQNGTCVLFGQNFTVYMYTYSCQPTNFTYSLKIPKSSLKVELQSTKWRCRSATNIVEGSEFMNLDIIIPVATVDISPSDSESAYDVDEYWNVTFTCITNSANPPPTILWFIGSSNVTSQAGSNRTTLTLNTTRAYHNMAVKCVAWNSGNKANLSDSTTLKVKYPPANIDQLRIMGYTTGQVLYENNPAMISINCTQPGGNPVVNITFTCGSRTGTNENTAIEAIRKFSLTNDRNLNGQQCACTSTHINGYMRHKNVSFTVYYPPSVPTISASSPFPWKASGTYSLTCNTNPGNPAATTYIWKEGGSVLPITSQTYEINPLNSTDKGRRLSCQVNNNFTLQQTVELTSRFTTLDVEYDPLVTIEKGHVEVIEGNTAILNCSATGNPAPNVTWYRGSTPVTPSTVSSSNYNIVNVSRTATGEYMCVARSSSAGSNKLHPSNETVYIRIFFPPTISILVKNTTENTENHIISCTATGDPNNATFGPLEQKIESTSIRNITSFTVSSPGNMAWIIPIVSYQDMGTYTCLASNGIPDRSNQKIQSDTAYLNVNTSAKFKMLQYTMRYGIGTIASVSIPFYRNPPATESDIMWVNTTGTSNKTLVSSANVLLSLAYTDAEQTLHGVDITLKGQSANMIIPTFHDYYEGNYTLKIRSSHADSAEVRIVLQLSGPPDTPSDFQLLTRKVTSVVLTWSKGSNGGHQQTFVVLYREKTAEVYDVKQIVDTTVYVTITDEIKHLKYDTSYEFILYSFNGKGNSTGNQALEERTLKAPVTSTPDSLNSELVGGTVGGGVAVLVVVVIILVVMRQRREKDKETHLYQNQDRSFYTDLQFDRPTTNDEEERAAYTMLQFGEQHTYSNIDNMHGTEGGR